MPQQIRIKGLGWVPDLPDSRDLLYSAPPRVLKALPPFIDMRSQMPAIYNQHSLGSCTSQAGSAIYQFNRIQQGIDWRCMPSRLFLYYNTRILQGTVSIDSGASIRNTIKAMVDTGMAPASDWPYKIANFAIKPPERVYKFAEKHKATVYERLPQDLNQLQGCLASGECFIFGFSVYSAFEGAEVTRTGVLNMPTRREQLLGGHAVLCCGYDNATRRFLVRNSWGENWGMSGYFTMPYIYLLDNNLADDFWTVKIVE